MSAIFVRHALRNRPAAPPERVVGGAAGVGWVEQKHAAKARTPSSGQGPVFSLDIVHDRGARPRQKRWHNEAGTFAASGRRKTQHMFGAVMPQIPAVPLAKQDAITSKQPGSPDIVVNRPAENLEPRMSELGLEGEPPGGPFGRSPDEGEDYSADDEDLAPEDLGRVHSQDQPSYADGVQGQTFIAGKRGCYRVQIGWFPSFRQYGLPLRIVKCPDLACARKSNRRCRPVSLCPRHADRVFLRAQAARAPAEI
jgi:hypothetical protein